MKQPTHAAGRAPAIARGGARCSKRASWSRFRPRPSTAWAPMPRIPAAVASIYAAKGRPSNHPVIVHLAPGADLGYWVERHARRDARKLMDAFWPGPLTLILKRAGAHSGLRSAGGQDIGRHALPVASGRAGAARSVQSIARRTRRRGGAIGQPIRPCQPDHGAACAG